MMAHVNIDRRRGAVEGLMIDGKLNALQVRQLASDFDCHVSAIRADIIVINNSRLKETYHVSKSKRAAVIDRDRSICYLCGKPVGQPIVEHKIPASQGGTATLDNLAVAHQSCNIKKRYEDNAK